MTQKKSAAEGPITAEERKAARAELAQQIVEAREAGDKWEDIAEKFGTSTGRAMLLHMEATVRPKDRIKAANDEELAGKIAAARDEDRLSWGQIMARTGLSETRCRSLYESSTGLSTRGNRVGKGGRYPEGTVPPARGGEQKEAATKRAAKSAAAKKAPAAKSPTIPQSAAKIAKMESVKEIADAVVGKAVTFKQGGKQTRVKVADLLDVTGSGESAELTVSDAEENETTILVSNILKVAAR
jgi:hypothetical protein